jgi:carbon-monoxide dehydrogenase large subunit
LVPSFIGRSTPRREDEHLITGRGRYASDIHPEHLAYAAFCRSQLPHARIVAIDRSVAAAMPGVIAVWTAEDLPETATGLSDFGPPDM